MEASLKIMVLCFQLAVLVQAAPNSNQECYEMNASKKCCTRNYNGEEKCYTSKGREKKIDCTKCCYTQTNGNEMCYIVQEHDKNLQQTPAVRTPKPKDCYYKDNNCQYCCTKNGYENCTPTPEYCKQNTQNNNHHNQNARTPKAKDCYYKDNNCNYCCTKNGYENCTPTPEYCKQNTQTHQHTPRSPVNNKPQKVWRQKSSYPQRPAAAPRRDQQIDLAPAILGFVGALKGALLASVIG